MAKKTALLPENPPEMSVELPPFCSLKAVENAFQSAFGIYDERKKKDIPILFQPLPGPQTMLFQTEAEIIGFGGAAGGSKTWGMLGLALTQHKKSVIFRREARQLREIIESSRTIIGEQGTFNENQLIYRGLPDGRMLEFGGVADEEDKKKWQGRAHDLKGFDEATEFTESQIRFLTAWNRTSIKGQRCRTILCFNPPTTVEGEWIIDFFAPWLKDDHENPAKPGELRWFAMVNDEDKEMPDSRSFVIVEGKVVYDFNPADYTPIQIIRPKSRTFIPAKVTDNPHLLATDYVSQLQALPEPLRSQMLEGKFNVRRDENPWQLIPGAFMDAAEKRWQEKLPDGARLVSLGLDIARGGKDNTVLSPVYKGTRNINGEIVEVLHWAKQISWPGVVTHTGEIAANLSIPYYQSGAVFNLDSIGNGASALDFLSKALNEAGKPPVVFGINNGQPHPKDPEKRDKKTGKPLPATDKSGKFPFITLRAQMAWRLREMMEPQSKTLVEMPPSRDLRSDLCTPVWRIQGGRIYVELKEDVKKRLPDRRSPDYGDSAILAVANLGPGRTKRKIPIS